jgi:TonB family protein
MGYQALLFCPDDKTSRAVTQVLTELDFTVVPCNEPFAAVKKMMAERFDAVVVDCDNEQNATLLFKSARNTASNQSSLAVAVVEGQAGVAKAFRIGANLVLTKPINVEQAKGTLRVARGLLRKNEATKSASPAGNAAKPAPAAPASKPAPQAGTQARNPKPASPVAPAIAAPSPPAAKAAKNFPAHDNKLVSAEADEPEIDLLEVDDEPVVSPTAARKVSAGAPAPPKTSAAAPMSRAGVAPAATSAASAPAPARDPKAAPAAHKTSAPIETINTQIETEGVTKVAGESGKLTQSSASAPLPAPTFTFGGAIESEAQAGKSGSKKVIFAVVAVVLIAAGGYAAWTQFGPSTSNSHPAAVQAAKIPAPAPAPATPAASTPVPAPSPAPSDTSADDKTEEDLNQPSPPAQPANSAHPSTKSKLSAATPSAKPSAPSRAESNTVADAESEPLVIKGGTVKPARKPAASDAAAPSLDGVAVGSAVPMSDLMVGNSNAPAPVLQTVNISQGVSEGLLIKRINPVYPANALRLRLEGTVQLLATVSGKGDVTGIKVISGDRLLAAAATDAVKQWKYKPYLLNGSPVEIHTEITVKFKLPQ